MNVEWKQGDGADHPKSHHKVFRHGGLTASQRPTWTWLCKNVDRCRVVVVWYGKDGWSRQAFGPANLATAKRFAKKVAMEHACCSRIIGEGSTWSPSGGGEMGIHRIFDFGRWEPAA